MRSRGRVLALATAALVAAFANLPARASGAGPVTTMRPNVATPAISYGSGTLVNHGGPVENGSVNYLVFWGLTAQVGQNCAVGLPCLGSDVVPYAYQIAQFFNDVSSTHLYSVLGQYGVHNASRLGGIYTDTPPTTTSVTDAQVQAEVRKAQAANGWPGGLGVNYFVFTPPGVTECDGAQCSGTDYCGYHDTMSDRTGVTTPYSIIPYPENTHLSCTEAAAPNVVPGADDAINITSHELFEILTDPLLSAWWDAAGYEVGDKCAWLFGTRSATGADVTVGLDSYSVQEEFSNSLNDCTM